MRHTILDSLTFPFLENAPWVRPRLINHYSKNDMKYGEMLVKMELPKVRRPPIETQ